MCDTRKTTPGLRALEKHAVRAGGGRSHRSTLADCALIKDNHIAAAGGVRAAVERVRARTPHVARVEVEVETPEQLAEALDAGADVILLDNMTPAEVRAAVETIGGRAITEASGSIHLDNVRAYAEAGVDMISTSALTSTVRRVRSEPGAGSRLMRTVRTDCLVIGCGAGRRRLRRTRPRRRAWSASCCQGSRARTSATARAPRAVSSIRRWTPTPCGATS